MESEYIKLEDEENVTSNEPHNVKEMYPIQLNYSQMYPICYHENISDILYRTFLKITIISTICLSVITLFKI